MRFVCSVESFRYELLIDCYQYIRCCWHGLSGLHCYKWETEPGAILDRRGNQDMLTAVCMMVPHSGLMHCAIAGRRASASHKPAQLELEKSALKTGHVGFQETGFAKTVGVATATGGLLRKKPPLLHHAARFPTIA